VNKIETAMVKALENKGWTRTPKGTFVRSTERYPHTAAAAVAESLRSS